MLLMKAGKTDDAFTLLQKATKNAPENVRLHILLARVAEVRGI
jgi:predicted Zn-dependent protease